MRCFVEFYAKGKFPPYHMESVEVPARTSGRDIARAFVSAVPVGDVIEVENYGGTREEYYKVIKGKRLLRVYPGRRSSTRREAAEGKHRNPRVSIPYGPGILLLPRGDGYVGTIQPFTVTFKKHADGWRWTLRGKAAKRPGNSPRGRGRHSTLAAAVQDAYNILGR